MHTILCSTHFLFLIIIFVFVDSQPLSLHDNKKFQNCSIPFECGQTILAYPFWGNRRIQDCGRPGLELKCQNSSTLIEINSENYSVLPIKQDQMLILQMNIFDSCPETFVSDTLGGSGPDNPNLIFLFNCHHSRPSKISHHFSCPKTNVTSEGFYVGALTTDLIHLCKARISVPFRPTSSEDLRLGLLNNERGLVKGFMLEYKEDLEANSSCVKYHGQCGYDWTENKPICFYRQSGNGKDKMKLWLGLGIGGLAILIIVFSSIYIIRRRCYKRKPSSAKFLSSNTPSDPSSKSDLEGGSVYFGVPIFSHSELEEATNNFDSEKELGDGGFGIVYRGKLRDGREVAVKRLFEHNYRRAEQFMNEIEILTRLRHKNLVTLYGCTSRRSRDLLLVYEYIPNGTVADHLHGEQAKPDSLTWPIRMNIAVETASALAYLHKSDTIHRDVKTNNILLDNNFSVKVADFGLSRLFPSNVTHVSTAPQGTPGYVDPDYHQCYQLTDRSDVYSFGVVLIELISSMPAVDIRRHRHEINLANFAINKIQKCAFDELIDPCLGHQSDEEVRRMTTSVAELAFRCLQQDKEMRPSMAEVLEELQRIQSGEYKLQDSEGHENNDVVQREQPPPSPPECDEVSLLKNIRLPPPSPISVTDKWISSNTTPNASG